MPYCKKDCRNKCCCFFFLLASVTIANWGGRGGKFSFFLKNKGPLPLNLLPAEVGGAMSIVLMLYLTFLQPAPWDIRLLIEGNRLIPLTPLVTSEVGKVSRAVCLRHLSHSPGAPNKRAKQAPRRDTDRPVPTCAQARTSHTDLRRCLDPSRGATRRRRGAWRPIHTPWQPRLQQPKRPGGAPEAAMGRDGEGRRGRPSAASPPRRGRTRALTPFARGCGARLHFSA